jgi:hypothetical protein
MFHPILSAETFEHPTLALMRGWLVSSAGVPFTPGRPTRLPVQLQPHRQAGSHHCPSGAPDSEAVQKDGHQTVTCQLALPAALRGIDGRENAFTRSLKRWHLS